MNQDFRKSQLSIEDLELSDQAYTLLALLCKDEACAYVRSAEDGNGFLSMASPLESTNSSECGKPLESVAGNQYSRHQIQESIFDKGTKMLRSTRHEPVNA